MNEQKTELGKEITAELYNNMDPKSQDSKLGKYISAYLFLNKEIQRGDQLIDFVQTNSKGDSIRLSANLGKKVTLLDFWASWCGPCRKENPKLVVYYDKYKNDGLAIIGVSLDSDQTDWLNAIKQDNLDWLQLSDLKGYQNQAALIYNVGGLPSSFLFDEEGKVLDLNLSGIQLEDKLETLFGY